MSGVDRRRVDAVCEAALERPLAERIAYVAAACGDDSALRREVEALLARAESADGFLGEPLAAVAAHALSNDAEGAIGRRIGAYHVVARLGAGGMGEVYRARDQELGRDVAIKMLPPEFSADRDRLARFEREARMLAALNHPNIAAIYGLEDAGGGRALVLELVEGDTLAEMIAHRRAGMAIRESLAIARQIAEALGAAHEKGIVHRDLKPSNIKVTPAGIVKVLDFGLAKSADSAAADLSRSPTLTVGGTRDGVLLGTAAYMSPEQARGQAVDKRADIWAFGCVLFEMLTGRMAFPGETVSDHIAAILEREPEWSALPATTPESIRRLLRRCVDKDTKRRLHDIADARIEIDEALAGAAAPIASPSTQWPRRRERIAWLAAMVAVAAAAWTAWTFGARRGVPVDRQTTRFVIQPPAAARMAGGFDISPDDSQLVYSVVEQGVSRLVLRRLDQFDGAALPGTEGAGGPFFSNDGEWLGFFADRKLQKINVRTAAAPIVLCGGIDMEGLNGASWLADDILFTSRQHGLQHVSAEGGEPGIATMLGKNPPEIDHHSPELLPGGRAVLFTVHQGEEQFRVAVQSLPSGQPKVLIESGFAAQYSPSGHVVYAKASAIFAVPFDLGRLEVTGPPVTLVEHVANRSRDGYGAFRLSKKGLLAFVPERSLAGRLLTWVNRAGVQTPLPIPPHAFRNPRVSPDGKRLAFAAADGERRDIWIYDLATDRLTRATSEGANQGPMWTPDGRWLTYTSTRAGVQSLLRQPADGNSSPESLSTSRNLLWSGAWTPDNRTLLYVEQDPTDNPRIFTSRIGEERPSPPILHAPVWEGHPRLSHDGHWLAFTSRETGRAEVYVQAFPDGGPRHQVTAEGGREPVWSSNGRELFFRSGRRMFGVAVDTSHGFTAGKPLPLFEGGYVIDSVNGLDYDVAPDGRFLLIKPSEEEQAPPRLNIVLNWVDELTRRVPTGK